jgi:hypothetical protein
MKICTNFTSMENRFDKRYFTKSDIIIQIPTVIGNNGQIPTSSQRFYMKPNEIVKSGLTIGVASFTAGFNISNVVNKPETLPNVGTLGIDDYLFVTFCDSNGKELFKNMPYKQLLPTLRKYTPLCGRIDPFRSYYTISNNAVVFTLDTVANISFYVNKLGNESHR